MKNLLIATSILAMSAGVASADIAFSGSASAGVAKDATNDGGTNLWDSYSYAKLAVAATGQTDSGLSFGANFDLTAGQDYSLADDDGFDPNGGSFGQPTVFVSGSFGKISFSHNNITFYDDATTGAGAEGDNGDIQYTGTFGGFGVGTILDLGSVAHGSAAAVQATYTLAGVALSADYNQLTVGADAALVNPLWNVSASYTMGSITGTLSAENAGDAANATSEAIKLAYSANGISASVKYHSSQVIDVAAGYTMGAYSINANSDDVTGANKWTVKGSYDLGGGLSLEAGANYTGDAMLGAKMSF